MSLCLNPNCLAVNTSNQKFCHKCGAKLLLQERYCALKLIGQGGFGKTYLATDEGKPSKPYCVIKQFFPIAQGTNNVEKAAELFEQEAVHLENLGKHPQIPELLSFFTQSEQQYLVQEYIQGNNLAQELKEKTVFTEAEVRSLLIDILQILEFVHSNQVIHRDIKPENIIKRNNDGKLVLVDFGAAKQATNTALAVTGTVIGSAGYTAPEQAIGKPNYASDLYSLGVTCIQLLTGVEPFELYSTLEADWVWRDFLNNNQVGDELGNILDKLIVQALRKRYQSSKEVLGLLRGKEAERKKVVISAVSPQIEQGNKSASNFIVSPQVKPENKSASNFSVDLGGGVSLDLVYIRGGTFRMGSSQEKNEQPIHQVKVPEFWIGKYQVTQEQWCRIMGNNPSAFQGDKRPVEQVSWNDAVEFCQRLTQNTGKEFRLPSEAEWEYSCRAGSETSYCFGEDSNRLKEYACYGIWLKGHDPVGQKKPNAWGLYDMHGNVWEWCADDWHDNYNGAPNDGSIWLSNSNIKILREGSWYSNAVLCRCASRGRLARVLRSNGLGFRVACGFPRTT